MCMPIALESFEVGHDHLRCHNLRFFYCIALGKITTRASFFISYCTLIVGFETSYANCYIFWAYNIISSHVHFSFYYSNQDISLKNLMCSNIFFFRLHDLLSPALFLETLLDIAEHVYFVYVKWWLFVGIYIE